MLPILPIHHLEDTVRAYTRQRDYSASGLYPHALAKRARLLAFGSLAFAMLSAGVLSGCSQSPAPTAVNTPVAAAATVATVSSAAPTPAPTATPTSAPSTPTPAAATPTAAVAGAVSQLAAKEYPIISTKADKPVGFEYMNYFSPGLQEQRKTERKQAQDIEAAAVNKVISKYGFELKVVPNQDCADCMNYELYQGSKQIKTNIFNVGMPTVNAKGDDFALWIAADRGEGVLRAKGLEPWEPGNHGYLGPVFVGNELVQIEGGSGDTAVVKRGDQVVYTTLGVGQRADNPNKGLWSWDGHWVLEVDGKLVIDGKEMNQELGYDEIFNWRLLNGQPFYFFRKGNSTGVSYAGKVLEQKYDEVVHYKCCETAMFNPIDYETLVQFHASHDGMWYYVEIGAK